MVAMYADLVEGQLRALTEEEAQAWGCPMVPAFLREKVKAEIEKREAEQGA